MPRTARVADPFAALDRALGRKLVAKSMPTWLEPMLATLTDDRFSNPNWIYERKLDGYRCIAYKRGNQVRLMSRNKKPMNEDYPEIVAALKTQPAGELIIDGEITAFEEGRSTFSAIQRRKMLPRAAGTTAKRGGLQLYYYIF
ncbi:MAG TPA: ATP-dependent DNA ligase, partial [bacterium]|nr:ATP-dependent DNA ligase [bacterium]